MGKLFSFNSRGWSLVAATFSIILIARSSYAETASADAMMGQLVKLKQEVTEQLKRCRGFTQQEIDSLKGSIRTTVAGSFNARFSERSMLSLATLGIVGGGDLGAQFGGPLGAVGRAAAGGLGGTGSLLGCIVFDPRVLAEVKRALAESKISCKDAEDYVKALESLKKDEHFFTPLQANELMDKLETIAGLVENLEKLDPAAPPQVQALVDSTKIWQTRTIKFTDVTQKAPKLSFAKWMELKVILNDTNRSSPSGLTNDQLAKEYQRFAEQSQQTHRPNRIEKINAGVSQQTNGHVNFGAWLVYYKKPDYNLQDLQKDFKDSTLPWGKLVYPRLEKEGDNALSNIKLGDGKPLKMPEPSTAVGFEFVDMGEMLASAPPKIPISATPIESVCNPNQSTVNWLAEGSSEAKEFFMSRPSDFNVRFAASDSSGGTVNGKHAGSK